MLSKSTSTLLCLMMTTLCVVVAVDTTTEPSTRNCNTLHAVFAHGGLHYFIYGNGQMAGVNNTGTIVYNGWATDTNFRFPTTAAVGDPSNGKYYMYAGDYEEGLPHFNNEQGLLPFYYSGGESELAKSQGYSYYVDAAYMGQNSTITYFSDCHYVKVDAYHLRVVGSGLNRDVGLPCKVDAAWSAPSHMIGFIIKGDQFYQWNHGQKKVLPPVKADTVFKFLPHFNLCSAGGV